MYALALDIHTPKALSTPCVVNAVYGLQYGDMKAAMDCCMQLHQWDQALQLAQQCNFTEAEGLLQQYAQHLLEKRKYLEAVELYRKVSND